LEDLYRDLVSDERKGKNDVRTRGRTRLEDGIRVDELCRKV
jgi:hypothetical protein